MKKEKGSGLFLNIDKQETGDGIFLNPTKSASIKHDNYKGKGISDFLKEHVKNSDLLDSDKKIIIQVLKSLKNGCKCKV